MRAREFVVEANEKQQLSLYNPNGKTYRQQAMPTLGPDPVDTAIPLGKIPRDQRQDRDFQQRLETNIDLKKLNKVLYQLLDQLDARSKQVLLLRANGMSLEDIGQKMGIGGERVRQIEAGALRKLRHPSKSNILKQFIYEPGDPRYGSVQPDTWFSAVNEKKDACYHKVRSRYKVWPSAYASGALVQCRKKGAKNWGNKSQ
jgi:RNA polymerase sigma factor (sigma-70 family)